MLQQTPTLTAGDLWVLTEISVPITSCPMYFPCHQSPDLMPRPPQLPKSFPEKILFPWQLWAETGLAHSRRPPATLYHLSKWIKT